MINAEMTYNLFWECLQVCFDNNNMALYRSIWKAYPNYSKNIKQAMPTMITPVELQAIKAASSISPTQAMYQSKLSATESPALRPG